MSSGTMPTHAITDEELLRRPRDGTKCELVDGELRVSPAGWLHERIVMRLARRMASFVEAGNLGDVLGSNALYGMPSGNKRSPDVSFVAAGRLDKSCPGEPFPRLAPDLAVEVLSPDDSAPYVLDKVGEYLQSGVKLIWVIDPEARSATVYRSPGDVHHVGADDVLSGEEVIPGFGCRLADVLG